jgi:hypothetical protein
VHVDHQMILKCVEHILDGAVNWVVWCAKDKTMADINDQSCHLKIVTGIQMVHDEAYALQ